ncbi:hypothetical protein DFH06DRAFT_1333339 [Mycena polygramma]|nr:hypothetical protein DFH06DRAFT_1333339 [Mycena polygramma]
MAALSPPSAAHRRHADPRQHFGRRKKQLCAIIFAFFTTGSGVSRFASFSSEIAARLKIVELNVRDDSSTGTAESEMVTEIEEVTENMCNVFGTMHGGCAVFLLDPTTAFAMVLLGRAKGFDGAGVSTSMHVSWHNPAPLGSQLTITTRSVYHDGRARLARCEMRDKGTRKRIVSGTHALVNSGNLKATTSKL